MCVESWFKSKRRLAISKFLKLFLLEKKLLELLNQKKLSVHDAYSFWIHILPVMAAVAVRKKVVSIGHFLPSFYLQSQHFFYLLDQIKSNCMYWLHWKSEKNRIEPNELDELQYSKSLNQISSYAHSKVFLYLHAQLKHLYILLKIRKKYWVKWAKWEKIL